MKQRSAKLITIVLVSIIIVVYQLAFSQFNFAYNDSVLVFKGSDTCSLAWSGGMSHPQFSTMDLDFDGVEEIVAFEPGTNSINVFKPIHKNGQIEYKYMYDWQAYFPNDITDRMKLVDFNMDGKKDLFTYYVGGIKVYKNISTPTTGIQWELYTNQIVTFVNGYYTNLHTSSNDIPAYADIDGDGDLDVITCNTTIFIAEWHKNLSMEVYGNADTLLFKLQEPCWGDFLENPVTSVIELNSTTSPCGNSSLMPYPIPKHQGGKSFLALDMNGSGMMDLIIGHIDFADLKLLINGGTNPDSNAIMTSYDPNFPSNSVPANLSNFLTAYYEDGDLDGINDLMVSTTNPGNSNNTKSVWFYKNTGANNFPNFQYVSNNFMQNEMIENGNGAIPTLLDVNKDGLLDLIVANNFNFGDSVANFSRMNYYKNIGTTQKPAFKLINEDWQSFSNSGFGKRISPAFGDLTGDGAPELITGLENGKLYYYQNPNSVGDVNYNIAPVQLQDYTGTYITVSNNATPELFDLNKDSLLDLIIGQENGGLKYYQNIGSATAFSFKLINGNLGGVSLVDSGFTASSGVPRFVRENDTTYLFVGKQSGKISFYTDIDGHLDSSEIFHLISSNYVNINTCGMSAPCVSNKLRNDGSYDLWVGTKLGGLWSYRPGDTSTFLGLQETVTTANDESFVYPNPTSGNFTLVLPKQTKENMRILVLDGLGREVQHTETRKENEINIQLINVQGGVYFVKAFNTSGFQCVKRIVVQ
jgi:hypothetical protein